MRIRTLFALPIIAGLLALPTVTTAQSVTARTGIRLPEINVGIYAPESHGAWRDNYRTWEPTTVYIVNGRYYGSRVRGSRSVVVYRRNNEYFLPPHEKAWEGHDDRYDYKRKPHKDDWNRGRGRGNGKGDGKNEH
jgi:hypothetical protein